MIPDEYDQARTASGVRVTLTKADGQWRVSAFEPVRSWFCGEAR